MSANAITSKVSLQNTIEILTHGKPAMMITAATVVSAVASLIFGSLYLGGFSSFIIPTLLSAAWVAGSVALMGMQVLTDYAPNLCKMIYGFIQGQPKILINGMWKGENINNAHFFDHRLSKELCLFFREERAQSVADFGCGTGEYVQKIRNQLNIQADGFDGNPDTPFISKGTCQTLDLSNPITLNPKYDWIISFEVGEHLPKQYEQSFIDNLIVNSEKGIVLSWAKKGQGGHGHFNEQNNDYIKAIFEKKGWFNDVETERRLRNASYPIYFWFYETIMVFRKPQS